MEYQLLQGDCLNVLRTLPAASVHCVVTSPPYFRLRDYGIDGQIGLEPTIGEYIAKMVEVFTEVRRVLRNDGTLWLNLGDKLENKNLLGIPWRVALALQADGWNLRSEIIWHKSNGMPESVADRPTRCHEHIFLLAKSDRYYYDAAAIAEPAQFWSGQAATFERTGAVSQHVLPGQTAAQHRPNRGKAGKNAFRGAGRERQGAKGPANREGRELTDVGYGQTRNKRSVWTVATKPYTEAHFATYPVELVQPCILAGSPANGTVLDPFNGSGTTGVAAIGLGRKYIGIELNPEYLEMAERRLSNTQPALLSV